MVSIANSNPEYILRDIVSSLSVKLKTIDPKSIDAAFVSWIYPKGREDIGAERPIDLLTSNYTHVAHLGYLIDIAPAEHAQLLNELKDGLNRMSLRPTTVMGSPAAFCSDAVAIFGIALGATRIGEETLLAIRNWMRSFPNLADTNIPSWKKTLISGAYGILGNSDRTDHYPPKNQASDMQLALSSRGIVGFSEIDFEQAYHTVCNGAIYEQDDFSVMGARLQAIDYLTNHLPAISLSQPSIDQIAKLLNNVTSAFRRWSWEEKAKTSTSTVQRWDLQNEYHVQNILYFLLAPIFPDIESEFYLENTGQLNPRADIGLPSLNLIIEVKFLRKTKNFQNMLEEIAADNTLYFKEDSVYKEKYTNMLVFLWDDTNRDHEHIIFKNGVNSFKNVVESVVISRPGFMNSPFSRESAPQKTRKTPK